MTISTELAVKRYDGDGSTHAFPTEFKFLQNGHVRVILVDAGGVEAVWVENTHYALTGSGSDSGGTVEVSTAPADHTPQPGETLVITRVVPETQETDYPEGGAFPAAAHEQALDLLTMMVQKHSEEILRALTFPIGDAVSSIGPLPGAAMRASRYLAFDSVGKPVPAAAPEGGNVVSGFMAAMLDDSDAAAARATLDIAEPITTRGDVIRGDTNGDPERLAIGAAGTLLSSDGTDVVWGFPVLDEDDMASGSATSLATQQSIKAYVDTEITAAKPAILHYREQRTSGTVGPTYSADGWRTVPLNTEVADAGGHGVLSSNKVTLAAGTYEAWANAAVTAGGTTIARLRLRDIENNTSLIPGLNGGQAAGTPDAPPLMLFGVFQLAAETDVELQIYPTENTTGGLTVSSGEVEVYSNLYLRKIA